MNNLNLKENVRGNASFAYFRDEALWYRTETGMLFPVPVRDVEGTQVLAVEKALFFMRWIRKYIASQIEPETDAR